MHSLGFSAPLRDAFDSEAVPPRVREELSDILQPEGTA